MNTLSHDREANQSKSAAERVSKKESSSESTVRFRDDRPEAFAQRKLQEAMNNSHRVTQLQSHQNVANNNSSALQFAGKAELQDIVDTTYPPIAKTLMAGVLDESSATAAAKKVYDNMFAYAPAHWSYKAGTTNSQGGSIIEGNATVGMCETYRNAFKYMLEQYVVPLTADYADFAGGFEIKEGQALATTKFVTKANLALLGNSSGYNVSRELDASNGTTSAVKHFLFSGHWQLIVNGKTYDPLFHEGKDSDIQWVITWVSDSYYTSGDVWFVANREAGPTSGGEFGTRYFLVRNPDRLEEPVKESDDVTNSHTVITEVLDDLVRVKTEWNRVRQQWTGKKAWRTPVQRDQAPQWIANLEALRNRANTAPEDNLLAKMTAQISCSILRTCQSKARLAILHLTDLKDTTKTKEMGPSLDRAIAPLNDALDRGIIRDI